MDQEYKNQVRILALAGDTDAMETYLKIATNEAREQAIKDLMKCKGSEVSEKILSMYGQGLITMKEGPWLQSLVRSANPSVGLEKETSDTMLAIRSITADPLVIEQFVNCGNLIAESGVTELLDVIDKTLGISFALSLFGKGITVQMLADAIGVGRDVLMQVLLSDRRTKKITKESLATQVISGNLRRNVAHGEKMESIAEDLFENVQTALPPVINVGVIVKNAPETDAEIINVLLEDKS
jgi:hypothetical protein